MKSPISEAHAFYPVNTGSSIIRFSNFLKLFIVSVFALMSLTSNATHFRYGNISWTRDVTNPKKVTFKVSQAWRTSYFYSGTVPSVGAQISSQTSLDFGDGSTASTIVLTLSSVNTADDWMYGDYTVVHTYASYTSDFTASFSNCCRISTLQNNHDANFTVSSIVKGASTPIMASPVSTENPIVNMSVGQTYATTTLPAADPNGYALTYSLTPNGSFGANTVQPANSSNFFINSTTGVLSFNTVGLTIGNLYNTSIKVTNSLGASTMVDFLIKMVDNTPPPIFTYGTGNTPNNSAIYKIRPGTSLNFPVIATNANTAAGAATTVTLSAVGLPSGSTLATQTGTNPATRNFSWTPTTSNLGTYVLTFVATNNAGAQTYTSVTIIVSVSPDFDPSTPGNNSTYCAPPGSATTPVKVKASNVDPTDLVSLNLLSPVLAGMSFTPSIPTTSSNPDSTVFTWTPLASQWGIHNILFQATDQQLNTTNLNYYYIVDRPPVFTSTPVLTATVGQTYTYNLTAVDADTAYGDFISMETFNGPSFLTANDLDHGHVQITGIPTAPGTYDIDIDLEDSLSHFNGTHCGDNLQSYQLVVSDCSPAVPSVSNVSRCGTGTVTLTATSAAGTVVDWYNVATGGTALASGTTYTPSVSATTTYYAVARNSTYGCVSARVAVTATVNVASSSTTNVSICQGANYAFNGTTYTSSGSYVAHLTNAVGCDSVATLVLTVNALPATPVVTVAQPVCGTTTGTITVTSPIGAGYTYSIDGLNYQSSPAFSNVAQHTTYNVTVKNSNGCVSTAPPVTVNVAPTKINDYVYVTNASSQPLSTNSFTFNTGATATGDTYIMNFGDGTSAYSSNPTKTFTQSGIYNIRLIATNTGGCSDTSYQTVLVTPASVAKQTIPNCGSRTPLTVTQTVIISPSLTDWGGSALKNISVNKFNSSLGTLLGVKIVNKGALIVDNKVEVTGNMGTGVKALVSMQTQGAMDFAGPGFLYGINPPAILDTFSSTGFDGTKDFAGTSGKDFGAQKTASSDSTIFTDASILTSYQGVGTVSLTAYTNTQFSTTIPTGNDTLVTNTVATDTAVIVYYYCANSSTSTTYATICSSALPYSWNGNSYSSAGTYQVTLTNVAGGDSIATLNLTVNAISSSTTNTTICSGSFPYTWNGFIYSVPGTYTIHLTNHAGCDSAATLVLTSGSPANIVVNQTAATCNSLNNPNYNGIITLTSATNATKFGISSLNAVPYNGTDYTHATAISSLPANVITNIPNTGGDYIVRVYGSDATCYSDINVTTSEVLCSVNCANTVFPTGSALSYINWVIPPYNSVTMTNFYEPGSASPNGSFTIYAPGNLTIQNQNLSDYAAFCSDITKTLYINSNYYDYRVVPLEFLAKENAGVAGTPGVQIPDGGIGPVRAGMVRYFVDKHFASTNSTDAAWSTDNHGTAFQIALWEITHDQYGVSPINFTVKNATSNGVYFDYNANSTANKAILDSAELWVKDIQNKSWDWTAYTATKWHAVAINSPSSQDLILAEPISVCAICTKPSAGADQSVCLDNSGTAHATLTGTTSASGTWTALSSNPAGASLSSTSSGVATATITAQGTYSFIFTTTIGGCSDTMTVVANAPTSSTTNVTICAGATYNFNGTGYTTAGTYTYHTTNAVGCDSAATLILTTQTLNSIVGDTTICLDSTKVLTNATTGGVWSSTNPTILTVDNAGNLTPVAAGKDTIYYTVAGCLAPASIVITVSDCSGVVDGGSGGGLESKSLGNAVSQRFINRVTSSVSETSDYNVLPNIANAKIQVLGSNGAVTLTGLLPSASSVATVLSGAINVYPTSPTDLVNMTNATDVQAQDYTINTGCKAVAFATSTNGVIYSHTKPICDRLREAQLLDIKNVTINNVSFVQYKLLQADGNTEYAISFSAGKNNNSSFYEIQSKWLMEDYTGLDKMYNFQIWGVNPQVVKSMVADVLSKLNNNLPYYQLTYSAVPKTYIFSHKRNQKSLDITINNNSSATTANLLVTDYMNELSVASPVRLVPVAINAFGQTTVSVDMQDKYQADFKLVDANLTAVNDEAYSNDGPWDISYNNATTAINNYSISNDNITPATGEWRLFRNVTVNATTSDYVSVYKLMKAAGLPRDISAYNSFKFTANTSGASAFTITFVKNSITDWNKQYSVTIPAANGTQDYTINYSDLVSAGLGNIDTKDITAVNIAVLVNNAHTNLKATISNARFVVANTVFVPVADTKMSLYPNPVTSNNFSCSFNALKAETLTMKVIETVTGRVVYMQTINSVPGNNTIKVLLNNTYLNSNNYVVTLQGDNTKYSSQNIVISRR